MRLCEPYARRSPRHDASRVDWESVSGAGPSRWSCLLDEAMQTNRAFERLDRARRRDGGCEHQNKGIKENTNPACVKQSARLDPAGRGRELFEARVQTAGRRCGRGNVNIRTKGSKKTRSQRVRNKAPGWIRQVAGGSCLRPGIKLRAGGVGGWM